MPDSISPHGDSLIIDMVRRFSRERLAPLAAEREKQRRIEPEIIAELGELGVFGATTPAEWDGSEADYPVERIYRDVRVCQIYEGTSDVQKLILQRML